MQQCYFDGSEYDGQAIYDFIRLSRTVSVPGGAPALALPVPGAALIPPATPVTSTGDVYRVSTRESTLRVRSDPFVSDPPTANVIDELSDELPFAR